MEFINKRKAMRGQGGFTLIELLVVIAILGILAGVVVFAVGNSTAKAKINACKTELRSIKTAAEAFAAEDPDNLYPADQAALEASGYIESTPKYWTYAVAGTPQVITWARINTTAAGDGATECPAP